MKGKFAAVAAASAVIGVLPASASADPGTGRPSNPQCYGQVASDLAQEFGGIPNAADAFGVTIQQGHNLVRAFCGRTSGYTPGK